MAGYAARDQGTDGRHPARGAREDPLAQRRAGVPAQRKGLSPLYPVELVGDRLRLREFSPADVETVTAYVHEQPWLFWPLDATTTIENAREWVEENLAHARSPDRTRHRLAVTLRDSDLLLGGARLYIENAWDAQGSVGYALKRDFWGQGYATEAATLALDLGFDHLGLHRIEAAIEPGNAASQRVVEKLGMRREGLLKGRIHDPDGWHDALLYATTVEEWRERYSSPT